MPATSAALREVRDRVSALQWRINRLTLIDAACTSLAAVLAAATAVVLAAGFAPAEIFGALAGGSAVAAAAACTAVAYRSWRRWVSPRAAARRADSGAHLQDRLTTAVWVAETAPRPRLAPVLLADVLERAASWRPERVEPRRVPRTAALPALSACLFVAALLAVRHLGPPGASGRREAEDPGSAALLSPNAAPRAQPSRSGAAARPRRSGERQASQAIESASAPTAGRSREEDAGSGAGSGGESAESPGEVAGLAGRLQAMIAGRRGEEKPHPGASGERSRRDPEGAPGSGRRSDPSSGDEPAQRGEAAPTLPRAKERAPGRTEMASQIAPERSSGTRGRAGAPSGAEPRPEGEEPQGRRDRSAENLPGETASGPAAPGIAPRAGTGSSPESLFGSNQEGRAERRGAAGRTGTSTFKLALFSLESPDRAAARAGKRASGSATAPVERRPAPLNPEQAEEESMERSQVPVLYENTVRRLYSPGSD